LEVTTQDENTVVINAKGSAVFSNFIPFKRQIEQLGLVNKNNVVVDLSACKLVDHSVMEKMHELQLDFEQAGLVLDVRGLDSHRTLSAHPLSTRKKGLTSVRRITMITDPELEPRLVNHIASLGASGYTSVPCVGVGRAAFNNPDRVPKQQVRIEVITRPDVALSLVRFVEEGMTADDHITLCIETVEVNRQAGF
jgi:MFS superfamily sulfate permease-like transporter